MRVVGGFVLRFGLCACVAVGCATSSEPWKDPADVVPDVVTPPDTDRGFHDTYTPADPTDTVPAVADADRDGVPDDEDNCVDAPNTDQANLDEDEFGDECDDDRDGDDIPNDRDLFADDPERPGAATQDHVYAHGPSALWRYDVPTSTLTPVGNFRFDQRSGSVTDVAIDRYGVLYAVTFTDAFVCHPYTAECWWIGTLAGSYNGLTFVPDDLGNEDVLVGITTSGGWTAYTGVPFALNPVSWGGYGGYGTSSGDAFHVRYTGTFAAVNGPSPYVEVVEVSTHGAVSRMVVELTGHSGVYGIAGAANKIFAFSSNGAVIEVKPSDGATRTVASGPSWWGAGVKTIVVP